MENTEGEDRWSLRSAGNLSQHAGTCRSSNPEAPAAWTARICGVKLMYMPVVIYGWLDVWVQRASTPEFKQNLKASSKLDHEISVD